MRLCSALLLCLAAASLSTAFVVSSPKIWTKLILTHHWPGTFCSMGHKCHLNISYWTLHGLWPDKGMNCNSSWHFDLSEIKDLVPDMNKSWPDLLKPSTPDFWKYEWAKHGTCAARAESLNSQHKYFSKALELYHKVDLDSILRKFDIIPDPEKTYSFSTIEGAIENFYGVKTKIQCARNKEDDVQSLGQIEICFSPDFTLEDCERHHDTMSKGGWEHKGSELMVCDHDIPVRYPPQQ